MKYLLLDSLIIFANVDQDTFILTRPCSLPWSTNMKILFPWRITFSNSVEEETVLTIARLESRFNTSRIPPARVTFLGSLSVNRITFKGFSKLIN